MRILNRVVVLNNEVVLLKQFLNLKVGTILNTLKVKPTRMQIKSNNNQSVFTKLGIMCIFVEI